MTLPPPDAAGLIPAAFAAQFSSAGAVGWIAALPGLVADTFRRWHLTVDGDPLTGCTALVLPVRDADGVRRAVKFSLVEDDNVGEIDALKLWDGRGAASLLRADPRRGVLLLEWLGEPIEDWWDAEEATATIASLYADLHRPAVPQLPDGHALVRGWLADLAQLGRRAPAPPRFVEWALRAGAELAAEPGTHVIHGDLHYLNVLRRGDGWAAIDPKGYNADPCLEVAPLLWNRWADLEASGDVGQAIRDRFYAIVDTAGLDERRARDGVVVRCLINVAWQAEPNAPAGAGLDSPQEWLTRNITVVSAMQALQVGDPF